MISSGIDALDARLGGGLLEGRYYVIGGSPGAGKTTACIQFLIEGLDRGERCALLTQENPNDLLDQARFLGYDFRSASERDQLAVMQYRLDFAHNYSRTANPEVLARELIDTIGASAPARLVIDTILPFADVGSGAHHAANALLHVMEHLSPTALFTVPGDVSDPYYTRLYDSVLSGAGGIFHLATVQSGIRELALRKVRQGPTEWAPLRMVLRPGIGLVTASETPRSERRAAVPVSHPQNAPTASQPSSQAGFAQPAQGVIIVDATGKLPPDLGSALQSRYDAKVVRIAAGDQVAPPGDDIGTIVIMLDAQEPEMTLAQVRQLRQAGADQAILLIVTGEGFRSATRARAIRAGADDVL
jgi:KaiC/GvpD/RAD55 family RecA-like ATPase